jgi:CBS domain-containing protein
MRISDILRSKGSSVVTVSPQATVDDLLALLAEHHIGAIVVSGDGSSVDGIVSERDVVRALAARGPGVLSATVDQIHTVDVTTADPGTRLEELMQVMTDGRFRHVPVVVDGQLQGIVSIGDVVKARITDLEVEREALAGYITSATT